MKRVQNFVGKHELWRPGSRIVIGVSGGPDSLCLLDVLAYLAPKYDFRLHVAHVNYGLRGRSSDLDEKLVRERSAFYGILCTVLRSRGKPAQNLEETLRDTRYAFFERLRERKDFDLVAVAHNEDDQAETFLMRLLRGSGLQGLRAMRPKNGSVIRPLLGTSRTDILRYLKERRLSSREDKSNRDTRLMRNRIRHELLPLLEEKFQPRTRKVLSATASLLAEDYATLEDFLSVKPEKGTKNDFILSRSELLALPLPLLRHRLRTLLTPLSQGKSPEKGLVDEIIKALKSQKNKHRNLIFHNLKLTVKGDTVRLFSTD